MKNKKGDFQYIFLLLFVIVLIAGVYWFNQTKQTQETTTSEWIKVQPQNQTINQDEEKSTRSIFGVKNNKETQSSSNEDKSTGGESTTNTQTIDETTICTSRIISYSLKTINQTETCLIENQGECIEKEITCSALIENKDSVQGYFEMELIFVPDGKSKETDGFGIKEESFILSGGKSQIMQGTATIQNNSQENLANGNINCFFNTINSLEVESC